jgi:hypothetical protein
MYPHIFLNNTGYYYITYTTDRELCKLRLENAALKDQSFQCQRFRHFCAGILQSSASFLCLFKASVSPSTFTTGNHQQVHCNFFKLSNYF